MSNSIIVSKLTSKCRTSVPKVVRERLGLRPGDMIRYVLGQDSVILKRLADASQPDCYPFAAFTEWQSEVDRCGYADL